MDICITVSYILFNNTIVSVIKGEKMYILEKFPDRNFIRGCWRRPAWAQAERACERTQGEMVRNVQKSLFEYMLCLSLVAWPQASNLVSLTFSSFINKDDLT